MRHLPVLALLLMGAGCQGLSERVHCRRGITECAPSEPCKQAEKKPVGSPGPDRPSEPVGAPRAEGGPVRVPTAGQDILLVPVTSYVPYARQIPTGPVRMAMPPERGAPRDADDDRRPVGSPGPEDRAAVKKLLELCEKQCERIDNLEKCLRERNGATPTIICPTPAPYCPQPFFFRRPFPLFPRCEPRCEPAEPCESILVSPGSMEQLKMPTKKPSVTIE